MTQLHPATYRIRLEPDLTDFTFTGSVEIRFEAEQPVESIKLNLLDMAVWDCKVRDDGNFIACPFRVDPKPEELTLFLPRPMKGSIPVKIDYQGRINDQMVGFYRSQYHDANKTKYIAVTQFEESDARRAFPCMDHPGVKATFDIELDIPIGLTAVSNGAVKRETHLKNGKKRVTFERTPIMSTYLVFIGVGEFEFVCDDEDRRVRAITLPGMNAHATFGLEFGRKSLGFSEAYYGIAYPLSKLDLIAIPDFAFGAMENWGAITFRENLLLHYPGVTSKSGEQRICEVIAHEIAHQWFGNLVTPSDWKHLWLNESFATYFGYGVVDHFFPEWNTWEQFIYGQTGASMDRDALHQTLAIEIPEGEHVVINASTAPIIYSKGGSILRQIEAYIGPEQFKNGLRRYLKTHEYGCAASRHLWESMEAASRLPIGKLMRNWVEQPGFPIVDIRREGNRLRVTQRRFTYLPNDSDQVWMIPLTITAFQPDGRVRQLQILVESPETTVELPENTVAYKANDRQTGFYIVKYTDPTDHQQLTQRIQDRSLPVEDRWGLQNDLFFRCKSGDASLGDYLGFLACYEKEDAFLPLMSISSHLLEAYLVVNDGCRAKIAAFAGPWFESVLQGIGFEPALDEKQTTSVLRDQLIWHAVLYGVGTVTEFARGQFAKLVEGEKIHPDILKSVMQAGAFAKGESAFGWLDARFQTAESEHERVNILIALGGFKDAPQIQKSQNYVLDAAPPRNKFIPVTAMASNPYATPLLWGWFETHFDRISGFHPMIYERIIAAIVPVVGPETADRVKAFFEKDAKRCGKAQDVIDLSLERLEINLRMRRSN